MRTWMVYKRLVVEYAFRYKLKLFIGLLTGFLAGGSIFGILFQLEGVLAPFSNDFKQHQKQVLVLQNNGQSKKVIVEPVELESKQEVLLSSKDTIIKVESYEKKVTDKIPSWAYPVLNKMGIKKEDILKDSNGIVMITAMVFLFLFFIFKTVTTFLNRFYMRWVGLRVVTDLREELFQHIMKQSFSFHNKTDAGELMSNVNNDTSVVNMAVSSTIAVITRAPIEIFCSLGYILYSTVKLGLYDLFFLMFVGVPCSLLVVIYLGKRMKKHVKKVFQQIASVISHMYEVLSCIRVVKAYHTENKEVKKFSKLNNDFFKSSIKVMKYDIAMTPLMEFVGVIAICVFLFICYLKGTSFAVVFPICIATNFAYSPLKQLSKINAQLQQTVVACDRIFGLLDTAVILTEKKDAQPLKEFKEEIVFENVSFSYDTKNVLDNINITIPKGKFVAFVGEAGSGKSTIVNLLCRFYDVTNGAIKIDGIDLRDLNVEDLRDRIAFIDQVSQLFNTTISDNIAYGKDNVGKEKIIEVAKKASADEFIMQKDEGYNFVVGEKGIKLSGGQRQRIAIARSLLKESAILILDEATSSLDSVTEKKVQNSINNLIGEQTIIAIAHRLSTIQKADEIFVMGDGKLLDSGTHEDLINRSGSYQDMWRAQFKKEKS